MKKEISIVIAVAVIGIGGYLVTRGVISSNSKQLAVVASSSYSGSDVEQQVYSMLGTIKDSSDRCSVSYAQALLYASKVYGDRKTSCGSMFLARHSSEIDFNTYYNCMISGATNLTSANQGALTAFTACKATASSTTASLSTRLSPSSPTKRIVAVSSFSAFTPNVNLGVFGLSVKNQNATIKSISFGITNAKNTATTSPVFSNIRLSVGGLTFGANPMVAGKVSFTNINIPLSVDQWKDVTILADIAPGYISNNTMSSTTLISSSIVGVSGDGKPVNISTASNITGNDSTFVQSGVSVNNASANLSNCTSTYGNGLVDSCSMTMSFMVYNTTNNDVFVSRLPNVALVTISTPYTSSTTLSSINIPAVPGDTTNSFIVLAGSARWFNYVGRFAKPAGVGFETFKITSIRYGNTTSANTTNVISSNLEALSVSR